MARPRYRLSCLLIAVAIGGAICAVFAEASRGNEVAMLLVPPLVAAGGIGAILGLLVGIQRLLVGPDPPPE